MMIPWALLIALVLDAFLTPSAAAPSHRYAKRSSNHFSVPAQRVRTLSLYRRGAEYSLAADHNVINFTVGT